jgi:predicted flap endonuclease-1-like 5' DNA nuclease
MPYLLTQIFLCLLVAFLLGLLIGWLIARAGCRARVEELERKLAACDDESAAIKDLQARLKQCEEGESRVAVPVVAAVPIAAPVKPDDLKKLWGIGPRMESLLNEADIFTFVALSQASVAKLRSIIEASGSKRLSDIANEETWAEQASMAAKGDWGALKGYQKNLTWKKGGKPD